MKKISNLSIIFLVIYLSSCVKKTNKESRQFESLVETTALSKDGKELEIFSRNFYVFESKAENLFDEKGYFRSENKESENLAEATIRSGVRNVVGKYYLDSLSTYDKTELGREIEDFVRSIKIESGTEEFDLRFNAILVEKINVQ